MKTINIEGVKYTIFLVAPNELMTTAKEIGDAKYSAIAHVVGPDGERFAGLCDTHDATIYVNKNIAKEKVAKTLIHEIIEAIDQECLLGLKHNVIQAITNALYNTGKFDVSEYLTEEDNAKEEKTSIKVGKPKYSS